jgi:hypothetical protein
LNLQLLNLDFGADLDPPYDIDADPDPALHSDVGPDPAFPTMML